MDIHKYNWRNNFFTNIYVNKNISFYHLVSFERYIYKIKNLFLLNDLL